MQKRPSHVSASSIELALSNPNGYVRKYITGEDRGKSNVYLDFGKRVTGAWEGTQPDAEIESLIVGVPRCSVTNHKLSFEVNNTPVIGYLDGFEEGIGFTDLKTGVHPWDEKRIQDSFQMRLYSLWWHNKYKTLPRVRIIWLPTREIIETGVSNRKVELIGGFVEVTNSHTVDVLIDTHNKIITGIKTIDDLWKNYSLQNPQK